jgi:hypothetical protein
VYDLEGGGSGLGVRRWVRQSNTEGPLRGLRLLMKRRV